MGGPSEVIRKARTGRCNRWNSAANITLSGNQVAEMALLHPRRRVQAARLPVWDAALAQLLFCDPPSPATVPHPT
jgi:hypothetical protein